MEKLNLLERFNVDTPDIIQLREKQLDALSQSHYPKIGKIKIEDFQFDQINTKYYDASQSRLDQQFMKRIEETENSVVVKDGHIIYQNLNDSFKDILIMTYFDALTKKNEEVLEVFKDNFYKQHEHKLLMLNAAFQNSALYIHVPKKTVIKDALKLYLISDKDTVHHTYLSVDKHSEFTLLEKLININDIHVNYVSDTTVLENAKVNYIGIDNLTSRTAFITRRGFVHQDASLIYALGQLNDSVTVSDNHIQLMGKNAYSESRNVILTEKNYTHAVTMKIEHLSPNTFGYITNHGIAKDEATLQIDGIGKIHQGMNASDNKQTSKVIMLSDTSKAYANPYLLIDEYDVMAGHGASVGSVDEEALYYLMSRGLTKVEAEKLIIMGFLYPIIEMIQSDSIKASFIQTIENKLK